MAAVSAGLVIGAGCSRGCPAAELIALVNEALVELDGRPVALATVDSRRSEPCMRAAADTYGVPLRAHPADALAQVSVPTPSDLVASHVGTPSVAEAAALLSAGGGATLLVTKRRSAHATCAVSAERA